MHTIFFISKACSGKDAQADLLKDRLEKEGRKVVKISTGDIFRDFARQMQSDQVPEDLRRVRDFCSCCDIDLDAELSKMKEGYLVDDRLAAFVFFDRYMEARRDNAEVVLTTGYPRNKDQYELLRTIQNLTKDSLIGIAMIIPDEIVRSRSADRFRRHGREDDSAAVVDCRLLEFEKFQQPLYEQLDQSSEVLRFDGLKSIESVQSDIVERLVRTGVLRHEIGLHEGLMVSKER